MLGNIFNVFSIFYAFRSLQIGAIVVRDWGKLRGPNFTPQTKSLAGQASFFLGVPVGVFFHELSHALAIWLFGGEVAQFAYRVFWGFVRPVGAFQANQNWFIALAGTLGSLVFGLFIWLALKNNKSLTFRYFGLRAFRYQIFFSLVYYPIFSAISLVGDWRMIYNFEVTPVLSGATAVIHAGFLFLFWQADRNGFFEMGTFGSPEMKERVARLEEKAADRPYDAPLQLQLIEAYRMGGMEKKAKQKAGKFLEENPNSAEGYLQLALLEEAGKRETPAKAKNYASKALSLGLNKPKANALAHQVIGRYHLDINKPQKAIDHLSQAIGTAKTADNKDLFVQLLYFRAQAYRRQEQYDTAYQDIQQAIQLAQNGNRGKLLSLLNRELETIVQHSGHSPEHFMTPPNK